MNVVPKTGGNTVKGSVYLSGVTKGMIGSNYTDDLKARGLSTPGSNTKIWDFNGAVGGPIKKDRLWFFYTLRDEGSHRTVPGMFANLNAGDPTKWTYARRSDSARRPGRVVPHDLAAAHRAGHAAQPVPRVLGRADAVRRRRVAGRADSVSACRQSGDNEIIAGGTAAPTPAASATAAPETAAYRDYGDALPAGDVAVADDEPPARSRRASATTPAGMAATPMPGSPAARLDSGHGTVRRPGARPTATSRA